MTDLLVSTGTRGGRVPPTAAPSDWTLEERRLAQIAIELGAARFGGKLSRAEEELLKSLGDLPAPGSGKVDSIRAAIAAGGDPLGAALCAMRPPRARRAQGAFYTPPEIVRPMIEWVLARSPERLVDAGCGSGRFVAAATRQCPDLPVIAIDIDPMATMLTRAALCVLGARNALVVQSDYMAQDIGRVAGRTAFVGNPPYVRHHGLTAAAKRWAVAAGKRLGQRTSSLSGLHTHFFLATALVANDGDIGCFVTSSEWLDVNYGSTIRGLLSGPLGGLSLHVIEPRAVPFADAMTTAVVSCFQVGVEGGSIQFRLVDSADDLVELDRGLEIPRNVAAKGRRWSEYLTAGTVSEQGGMVPLGEVAEVHRGLVTGANEFFVLTRERARSLGIERWCRPVIASAQEILQSGGIIRDTPSRKVLLDVPRDITREAHPELDAYLRTGESTSGAIAGISDRYIPSHRRPWWYLGHQLPPPIVATYMARQAPFFATNPDGLALVNIGHGIYPTGGFSSQALAGLSESLNLARERFRGKGRTYHGGLEKFEPREMESLLVDPPAGSVA